MTCSFCNRAVAIVLSHGDHHVCSECVDVALDIAAMELGLDTGDDGPTTEQLQLIARAQDARDAQPAPTVDTSIAWFACGFCNAHRLMRVKIIVGPGHSAFLCNRCALEASGRGS